MSNTFAGKHKAVVKETDNGIPYICFDLLGEKEISGLKKANIGMILDKSTSREEALNIAKVINEKLVGLYITGF